MITTGQRMSTVFEKQSQAVATLTGGLGGCSSCAPSPALYGATSLGMEYGNRHSRYGEPLVTRYEQPKALRFDEAPRISRAPTQLNYLSGADAGLGDGDCALGLPSWAILLGGLAAGAVVGWVIAKR